MNEVKYYKEVFNDDKSAFYLKVIDNKNVVSVLDSEFTPNISYNSYCLRDLITCVEITESEFNEAFNRVINFLKGV
jgi:hypothetical protein